MSRISIDLRDRVMRWARIIEENIPKVLAMRQEAMNNLAIEMREFTSEKKFSIIFYDDAIMEPCPECDYERGRVYQWLGYWYFMCMNCTHGMPDPVRVDWGKYGELNEEKRKE